MMVEDPKCLFQSFLSLVSFLRGGASCLGARGLAAKTAAKLETEDFEQLLSIV